MGSSQERGRSDCLTKPMAIIKGYGTEESRSLEGVEWRTEFSQVELESASDICVLVVSSELSELFFNALEKLSFFLRRILLEAATPCLSLSLSVAVDCCLADV